MKNRRYMDNKGFTLVELLVVIAILAIIVSIALPVLYDNVIVSKKQVDISNGRVIALSVMEVMIANDQYTSHTGTHDLNDDSDDTAFELLVKQNMQTVPTIKTKQDKHFIIHIDSNASIKILDDDGTNIYPNPESPYAQ